MLACVMRAKNSVAFPRKRRAVRRAYSVLVEHRRRASVRLPTAEKTGEVIEG